MSSDSTPVGGHPPSAASVRHQTITSRLEGEGRVEVTELADRLGVSEETIRRDLRALESEGLLVRAHGGAVRASDGPRAVPVLNENDRAFFERVAEEIPTEGAVYLDGDAPAEAIIGLLATDRGLTVITPRLDLAMAASLRLGIDVLSLGGELSPSGGQSGEWARLTLESLRIDTAVIFADGCSDHGELLGHPADAQLRVTALSRARRSVLALRIGNSDPRHFTSFAAIDDFDTVVVDAAAAGRTRELLDDDDSLIVAGAR